MNRLYQRIIAVLALAGLTYGLTIWLGNSRTFPSPPDIDFKDLDPAVAKAIKDCRDRVLSSQCKASDWGNLGMVLSAHDFIDEADYCFGEAERLDDSEPRWPYFQGLSLIRNDPANALPKLRKAVKHAGAMTFPRLRLSKVLTELGQFEEAESLLRIVVQAEPDNPWAQLGLGRVYFERGQYQECLTALEIPATHPATRKAAKTMRASIFSQKENPTEAKAEMAEIARLPEDQPLPDPWVREMNRTMVGMKAMLTQINQMLASGRGNEAAQLLLQLVQLYPQSEEAWRFAGQLLLKSNDLPNAESAWRHALEQAPDSVVAHYHLGLALFRQGKFAIAAPSFVRTTELKSDHGMAYYFFGKCMEQEKEFLQAIEAFRQASRCQPQTAEIHLALGDALERDGKPIEAVTALERAVALRPDDENLILRIAKLRNTD